MSAFKNALFSAALRTEIVEIAPGLRIVIRQITVADFERLSKIMADPNMSLGRRNGAFLNARCSNEDGSALFDDNDLSVLAANVAVDNPLMNAAIQAVTDFDARTQALHQDNLGK